MANPLQPKCIDIIEKEFGGYTINVTSASKSGHMDLIACVPRLIRVDEPAPVGLFYGFEIKWKSDTPSELQKQKINALIDAGGKGYFIRSTEQLRSILMLNIKPIKYDLKNKIIM